ILSKCASILRFTDAVWAADPTMVTGQRIIANGPASAVQPKAFPTYSLFAPGCFFPRERKQRFVAQVNGYRAFLNPIGFRSIIFCFQEKGQYPIGGNVGIEGLLRLTFGSKLLNR